MKDIESTARKQKCGAKTRSGSKCEKWAMNGAERCRLHGGATPRGHASPAFKHGRYSKALPARLLSRYMEAAEDPELLSSHAEIALLRMRVSELLGQLDTTGNEGAWGEMGLLVKELERSLHASDTAVYMASMERAKLLVSEFTNDTEQWELIMKTMEQLRKTLDSENRRQLQLDTLYTADELITVIQSVLAAVVEEVYDDRQRDATVQRIYEIFDRNRPVSNVQYVLS